MAEVSSMANAVKIAKDFLREAGVPTLYCVLKEAKLEDNKWRVVFDYEFFLTTRTYAIEIDNKTGEVVGYKRKVEV